MASAAALPMTRYPIFGAAEGSAGSSVTMGEGEKRA